jgi:hypothetical protein
MGWSRVIPQGFPAAVAVSARVADAGAVMVVFQFIFSCLRPVLRRR